MLTAKEAFERTVAAWNAGDESGVLALGSPDIVLTASGGLDYSGLDGIRQWYRLWTDACPDRKVAYFNVLSEGDQVIGEGTFSGTHTGLLRLPTGDVPPTGRRLKADFAAVARFKDGKMTYLRHYIDVMDLMIQLGLAAAPAAV